MIHKQFAERYGAATLVRRLFSEEAARHWLSYATNFALMGLTAGCTALTAYLIGHVVNQTYLARDFAALIALSLVTIAVFTVKGLSSYGQAVLMAQIGNEVIARNQRRVIDKLLRENLGYFADRQSANIMAQVDCGSRSVASVLETLTTAVGRDGLCLIGLAAVMFIQDPLVSIIALVAMPAVVLTARRVIGRVRRGALDQLASTAMIMEIMQECFQGLRTVKAFELEDEMRRRVAVTTEAAKSTANTMARLSNRSGPLMEGLGGCVIALVFLYGGYRVIVTGSPPGEFISFITAFLLAYEPAKRLARLQVDLGVKLAGVRMFYEMLDTPATEPEDANAPALQLGQGRIEFRDVEFSYRPGRDALRGLTFIARPNRLTALVGPSGGGKSTAFSLLLRLYEADKGAILIDGQDITAVSRRSLRRQIAYVGQDVFLFRGTIRENIAFGDLAAGEDDIIAAAKTAQAHDFIAGFPAGYDTPIGENGLQLSSGQRQRISIARALLKDARIILLDEPTSSLDGEAEQLIRQALARLCEGRTTLVIAHRLNTVTDADRINVIENGVVTESGRHEEFLYKGGRYASLYRLLLNDTQADDGYVAPLRKLA